MSGSPFPGWNSVSEANNDHQWHLVEFMKVCSSWVTCLLLQISICGVQLPFIAAFQLGLLAAWSPDKGRSIVGRSGYPPSLYKRSLEHIGAFLGQNLLYLTRSLHFLPSNSGGSGVNVRHNDRTRRWTSPNWDLPVVTLASPRKSHWSPRCSSRAVNQRFPSSFFRLWY